MEDIRDKLDFSGQHLAVQMLYPHWRRWRGSWNLTLYLLQQMQPLQSDHPQYPHCSNLHIGTDSIHLAGFPSLALCFDLVDSVQSIYDQKTAASVNTFRLFPPGLIFQSHPRVSGTLLENIPSLAGQFQFQEMQTSSDQRLNKSRQLSTTSLSDLKHLYSLPTYRIYSFEDKILGDSYNVLFPEVYKVVKAEEMLRSKVDQWIGVGYHPNLLQAFKLEKVSKRISILIEKVEPMTLRNLIDNFGTIDKNQRPKSIINVLIQVLTGIRYLHRRGIIHQNISPQNIFILGEGQLKIGGMYLFNGATSEKNCFNGGSPEYWSKQQASIYTTLRQRCRDSSISNSISNSNSNSISNIVMSLPNVTHETDYYQLGLILVEMMYGKRWNRGDQLNLSETFQLNSSIEESQFLGDVVRRLMEKGNSLDATEMIVSLLDKYSQLYPCEQLWMGFYDESTYQSEKLNKEAIGQYLSIKDTSMQTWRESLGRDPCNVVAQFNYSHYRRNLRQIDDLELNNSLLLLQESRKRNYYLLISNLISIAWMKEPLKSFNFNPKLSTGKEISVINSVINELTNIDIGKVNKRIYVGWEEYEDFKVVGHNGYFRVANTNSVHVYYLYASIKSYESTVIRCPKNVQRKGVRLLAVDQRQHFLAASDNNYLCLMKLHENPEEMISTELTFSDGIISLEFDVVGDILAISTSDCWLILLNTNSSETFKKSRMQEIPLNVQFFDRNSCICYSNQKSIHLYKIENGNSTVLFKTTHLIKGFKAVESNWTLVVLTERGFEMWSVKDKSKTKLVEVNGSILGFDIFRRNIVYFTPTQAVVWNTITNYITKTYVFGGLSRMCVASKHLFLLNTQGFLEVRNLDWEDLEKVFFNTCTPEELDVTKEYEKTHDDNLSTLGKQMLELLREHREYSRQESLLAAYCIAQNIKNEFFFQSKSEIKRLFKYMNSLKRMEAKSQKINAHSEDHVFGAEGVEVSFVSEMSDGRFVIGETFGMVRVVEPPFDLIWSHQVCQGSIGFASLDKGVVFVSSGSLCCEVSDGQVRTLHRDVNTEDILYGARLGELVLTVDRKDIVLFLSRDSVLRYPARNPCYCKLVDTTLYLCSKDNRIRIYTVAPNGLERVFVLVGHVLPSFRVIVEGTRLASFSFDNTLRLWNDKSLQGYFQITNILGDSTLLDADLSSVSDICNGRVAYLLLLINSSEVVVLETSRKEVKYRLELPEDLRKVFWTEYPDTFAVMTQWGVRVYSLFWKYSKKTS